jgi:hypothetical protein
MMLPVTTAAGRQFPLRIGCQQRREQRDAEQRDKQQCERATHLSDQV